MDLGTLRAMRADLTLEYDGETLHFAIRPNVITPAYRDHLRAEMAAREAAGASSESLSAKTIVRNVADLILEWDLVDQGLSVPVNEEAVAALPEDLVIKLWKTIDDFLGKRIAGKPSA